MNFLLVNDDGIESEGLHALANALATVGNVYVAAEHSAQLDRAILENYTNQFKGTPGTPGKLNILNCSTTMEMGVDIGDIDLVFLANVPPEASNYLQRAGRAGRFGQSKAVAFTACPCTPEGLSTFFTPGLMLEDKAAKRMPKESQVIVERHINSFFFRDFILAGGMSVSGDSSAADFFTPQQTGAPTVCDTFIAHLGSISTPPSLILGSSAEAVDIGLGVAHVPHNQEYESNDRDDAPKPVGTALPDVMQSAPRYGKIGDERGQAYYAIDCAGLSVDGIVNAGCDGVEYTQEDHNPPELGAACASPEIGVIAKE